MGDENFRLKHLEPFLDGTPLALERIKGAWPGLTLADRAHLLSVLLADPDGHPNALIWRRHHNALIELALGDENAYIRYLAAKRLGPLDEDDTAEARARIERIGADASQLVRAARQEAGVVSPPFKVRGNDPLMDAISPTYDPARFWTLHPTHRLAVATWSSWDFSVVEPLRYAAKDLLPKGGITENELADVLLQFLGPDYVRRFADKEPRAGRSRYHFDKEVEELWKAVPEIPKTLSYILLKCLPGGDKHSSIPSGVLESLDEDQLAWLLRRDDIVLAEFRRQLYVESGSEKLRRAAVASAKFELHDSDISRLVSEASDSQESKDKRVKELLMLAENCRGASLVQMEAIYHSISSIQGDYSPTGTGDCLQSNRAKRLWDDGRGGSALDLEVLQLRVFELAKGLSSTGADEGAFRLPESLKAHQQLIAPKDPWRTYLNLWPAISAASWKREKGELPSAWIRDFRLPDESLREQG